MHYLVVHAGICMISAEIKFEFYHLTSLTAIISWALLLKTKRILVLAKEILRPSYKLIFFVKS